MKRSEWASRHRRGQCRQEGQKRSGTISSTRRWVHQRTSPPVACLRSPPVACLLVLTIGSAPPIYLLCFQVLTRYCSCLLWPINKPSGLQKVFFHLVYRCWRHAAPFLYFMSRMLLERSYAPLMQNFHSKNLHIMNIRYENHLDLTKDALVASFVKKGILNEFTTTRSS